MGDSAFLFHLKSQTLNTQFLISKFHVQCPKSINQLHPCNSWFPLAQALESNSPDSTLGRKVLQNFGVQQEAYWYWVGIAALYGFTILLNVIYALSLTYLQRKPTSRTHPDDSYNLAKPSTVRCEDTNNSMICQQRWESHNQSYPEQPLLKRMASPSRQEIIKTLWFQPESSPENFKPDLKPSRLTPTV